MIASLLRGMHSRLFRREYTGPGGKEHRGNYEVDRLLAIMDAIMVGRQWHDGASVTTPRVRCKQYVLRTMEGSSPLMGGLCVSQEMALQSSA